jgi:hypothetical protein
VLEFTGASTEYTLDGGIVTFQSDMATLTFTGTAAGQSEIVVTSPTLTGSSTVVSVADTSAAGDDGDQTQSVTTDEPEGQFTIDGIGYVVSERYAENMIPAGFSRTTVTIDGYGYRELTNGTITLLYLKRASDTSSDGSFYIYDQESNSVSPFHMLGSGQDYVLLQSPEQPASEAMTLVTISVEGSDLQVYSLGTEDDFYFVYGMNQDGVTGWYQYDAMYGTLQRMNERVLNETTEQISADGEVLTSSEETEAYAAKVARQRYIMAALVFILVVEFIAIMNLLLDRKRIQEESAASTEEFTDREPDDEETDDPVTEDDALQLQESKAQESTAESGDDEKFYEKDSPDIRQMFSTGQASQEVADVELPEQEASGSGAATSENEDESGYSNLHGAEAFRSKKDTHYKSDGNGQLDILDLNDL